MTVLRAPLGPRFPRLSVPKRGRRPRLTCVVNGQMGEAMYGGTVAGNGLSPARFMSMCQHLGVWPWLMADECLTFGFPRKPSAEAWRVQIEEALPLPSGIPSLVKCLCTAIFLLLSDMSGKSLTKWDPSIPFWACFMPRVSKYRCPRSTMRLLVLHSADNLWLQHQLKVSCLQLADELSAEVCRDVCGWRARGACCVEQRGGEPDARREGSYYQIMRNGGRMRRSQLLLD